VVDTADTRAALDRLTAGCRRMPPLLLVATSVMLTVLPARFGPWLLVASAGSVLLCYPPGPAQIRLWWRLLSHPEGIADSQTSPVPLGNLSLEVGSPGNGLPHHGPPHQPTVETTMPVQVKPRRLVG